MKKNIFIFFLPFLFFSCMPYNGSKPGDPPPVPSNVVASKLEYTNMIKVTWDYVAEAESYRVYRYTQRIPELVLDEVLNSDKNILEDTIVNSNTPYFYSVSSFGSGKESEQSANCVLGIKSSDSLKDTYEPNDDMSQATMLVSGTYKATMFTFHSGDAQDTDYYQYSGNTITGIITLSENTPFKNGEVLRLRINGSDKGNLGVGDNSINYSGSGPDIFIVIDFPNATPDNDAIGSYSILIN